MKIKLSDNEDNKNLELIEYSNELEERIDKAIKMLEESQKGLEEWHFDGYDPDLKEIIKILKGVDKE